MTRTTSPQRRAIPGLVARIRVVDPYAGVVLQGSVQHGTERPTSDIDLTVVLTDREHRPQNELIAPENRGGMIRVHWPDPQVDVDVNWLGYADMMTVLSGDGAREWFIFSHGEIVHDPRGLASECQARGRRWFAENPAVADAWRRQNEEVRRAKLDPEHVLEYPKWADFSVLLRRLVSSN